jgi:tetratricopeptide (TPR) repeat protein
VPPTIEGLLSARIDDLPARDREILHVASILGRRVHEPMLRGLLDDPSDLEAAIGRLVETGLLDHAMGDGEHVAQFHHALVQDVAYSRLLRRRRRELHLRAADTAERLYGSGDDAIDLLAGHLYLGRAGARAVAALLRAADRARRLFANAEAILALERAEESAMADATAAGALPRIRLELAQVLELVGSYETAIRRYEEVRDATGDPRAWRGLAAAHRRVGDYEVAIAAAEDGLAAISGSADARPLILERAAALSVSGRRADALELLEAALRGEPATDDPVGGHLLLQLARARTVAGRSAEAIPLAERAVAILEQAGDPAAASSALRVLGNAYSSADRIREAEATLARGLSLAERVGSSEEIGGSLINLGVLAMDQGRADDAIDSYRRAVDEFERIGHASGRVTGYANLADALLQRGDLDEALQWAARAVDAARSLGHALGLADALDTMAAIHGRRGERDRAADLAVEAARAYAAAGAAVREAEALASASAWRDGARDRADHSKPLRPGGPSSNA